MLSTHYAAFAMAFVPVVVLASWWFKRRGALLSVGGVLAALAVLNTLVTGGLGWPPALLFAFLLGGSALGLVSAIVSLLGYALDLSRRAEERQRLLHRAREQFLLNVSHELRTPLTQLHGYLELLCEHRGQLDEDTQALFLRHALQGCEELTLLVGSILDAAQSSRGVRAPRCQALSLSGAVQDTLALFEPQTLASFSLQLDVPAELAVWADPQQTRQVLRNLLANAFKYAPRGTAVGVSAASCEGEGSFPMVRLCVRDAGPGIPPTEAPQLFEQFARLGRDLAGPTEGMGLGLYISKQLVEGMGGRIWVESTGVPGQGSCFCFTLPCTPESPQGDHRALHHKRGK
jgi:signal transduction histidine kinase